MQTITTKNISKLRFPPGNVQQIAAIYKGIEKAFRQNDLNTLFAVPVLKPDNEMEWRTPLEGKIQRYDALSGNEQAEVDRLLVEKVNRLLQVAKADPSFQAKIRKWLEIPAKEQDVFLVGNHVVLTSWGFISFHDVVPPGTISKLLKTKKHQLHVRARYEDDTPVVELSIAYATAKRKDQVVTDERGNAIIQGLPDGSDVRINATHNQEEKFEEFTITEDVTCKLLFPKLQDITVTVIDSNTGQPVTGESFKVVTDKLEGVFITDEEGSILLENIRVGQAVSLTHQEGLLTAPASFDCEPEVLLYTIKLTVPVPEVFEKKIKIFYEPTGKAMPGARVTVTANVETTEHVTDTEGFITLQSENAPITGQVKLEIEAAVKPYREKRGVSKLFEKLRKI